MAKLSRIDRNAQIAQQEEVSRIRRRYADALQLGYSVEDAAAFANGHGELSHAPTKPPAETPTHTVSVSGGGKSYEDVPEIPPNWQDLPWPDLKRLADRIHGSDVKSRKQASEIISKAVAGN